MGRIRTGTVGFSYRDWMGGFYPHGAPPRRQLNLYCEKFDACELTQFTHHMPDAERVAHFAAQLKADIQVFVRIHNTFTHCADVALALSMARHFRKAIEPLSDAGKLAGLVAPFPYAFKNTPERRDYVQQLASSLEFAGAPLQLDFRHPSWLVEGGIEWIRRQGLGLVCVDEPSLPGLVPPLAVATTDRVLIRFHGRNAETWWSGNATTRHDYSYSATELRELIGRYSSLLGSTTQVYFLFQNHWQAQSAYNALQWKGLLGERAQISSPSLGLSRSLSSRSISPNQGSDVGRDDEKSADLDLDPMSDGLPNPEIPTPTTEEEPAPAVIPPLDDDVTRPPATLPLAEVKMRVSREFSNLQTTLELPQRTLED